MELKVIMCDVEGCKREACGSFQVFKERKMDGTGSSVNYYWQFDLCVTHLYEAFGWLLDKTGNIEFHVQKLMEVFKIKTRVV